MSDGHSFATLLNLKRITRAMADKVPLKVLALLNQDLAFSLADDGKVVEATLAGQQALVMENLGGMFEAIVGDLKPESVPITLTFDIKRMADRYRAMSWKDLG